MAGEELVEEVAFAPHDLDPVIARLARPRGGGGEIGDLLLDPGCVECARGERGDRRFDRARAHAVAPVGIAAGVQDLHRDLAALGVDPVGHHRGGCATSSTPNMPAASGKHRAFRVRRDAAGDDEPGPAARARGVVLGHPVPVAALFEAGMHRAHQHAVRQRGEAEVERGEQVRVEGHGATIDRSAAACHL